MALIDGLKGLWHFNNDWLDASGNGNHGTPLGATFSTAAKLGSHAGLLDAVDDSVACGATLNVTTEFTYHAWIKRNSINKDSYIMHKSPVSNTGGPILYINSSNLLSFLINNVAFIITATSTITDTSSYHHVMVSRNTANIWKMYIDGVLHEQVTNTNVPIDNALNFTLGHQTEGLGALLDEAGVWSRAITDGGVSVGQLAGGEAGELWNGGAGVEIGAGVKTLIPFVPKVIQSRNPFKAVKQ
ncbi:MAG: LamG domain-containing protein [Thermodesulfobacteriota bacterium]